MENKGTILVVDDTPLNIRVLLEYLNKHGYKVLVSRDGKNAIKQTRYAKPELILLDIMMPEMDGVETCERLKQDPETKDIPILFITALSDTEEKVKGLSAGAVDYITKPIQYQEVLARISTHLALSRLQKQIQKHNVELEKKVSERTQELTEANQNLRRALVELEVLKNRLQEENNYLQQEINDKHNFQEIIGQTSSLKDVLFQVEQVANIDTTVLVLGDTGTGKELIARAIHNNSPRKDRPLVKINCAALPANLIESELFGHEKGAFTGATYRKKGRFELADNGTIFLDEVGELPLDLQAKLLRVLQEKEFEVLGNPKTQKVNVRVIAATNRDLKESVKKGEFRQDLYYRLNVFPIKLPSLKERKQDIPLLVQHFVDIYSSKIGKDITQIPSKTMDNLKNYHWPGNIRELENIIERAVILAQSGVLQIANFDEPIEEILEEIEEPQNCSLEEIEKAHILRILRKTNWVIEGDKGAALVLGLNPSTLRSRMRKLGIKKPKIT